MVKMNHFPHPYQCFIYTRLALFQTMRAGKSLPFGITPTRRFYSMLCQTIFFNLLQTWSTSLLTCPQVKVILGKRAGGFGDLLLMFGPFCHFFKIRLSPHSVMTQLLLLGKFEYGWGPIFKVVLECWKRCSEPFLINIYSIQCDFMPKRCWEHSNFENR